MYTFKNTKVCSKLQVVSLVNCTQKIVILDVAWGRKEIKRIESGAQNKISFPTYFPNCQNIDVRLELLCLCC